MNRSTWQPPRAREIVQIALTWVAIYASEFVAAFILNWQGESKAYYHLAFIVAVSLFVAVRALGQQKFILDIQDLFFYDVMVVIIGLIAFHYGVPRRVYLTMAHFVFILKVCRTIWPLLEYGLKRQIVWPIVGPVRIVKNWGQPGNSPTGLTVFKMCLFCVTVAPIAIGMQATLEDAKNPIPYPAIFTLLFTGIVTARLVKNLEDREHEHEQAMQKLGAETGRAEAAEQYAAELAAQRDEISALREKDRQRAQDLAERNESLRNANHDVKQPIHNLRYYAHRLAETASTAEQRALATALETGLYELSSMIHSTIDQAKISTRLGAPVTQALATLDLAQYFHTQFFEHAQARRIYFEQKTHACTVQADAVLLKRVLSNLVNNAILHSPPATVVQLRFYATANYCMVRVWNRGAVIPDANGLDRVANFAAFIEHCKQAENAITTARIPTNHGLGLISVQRLCHEMGVTMQLKARPGLGTVFRFRLPVAAT